MIHCYVSVPKKHGDFNYNLHLNAGNELTLRKSFNVSVLACLSGKTKNKQKTTKISQKLTLTNLSVIYRFCVDLSRTKTKILVCSMTKPLFLSAFL